MRHASLVVLAGLLVACGGDTPNVACPLLPPGALTTLPRGGSLPVTAEPQGFTSVVGPGGLVAHSLWLAAGEEVRVSAAIPGGVLFAYGPRSVFGGFAHCRAASQGAKPSLTLKSDEAGEFLVLVGAAPGAGTLDYEIDAQCEDGCSSEPRCPTLNDLGCGDARCDGQLARDAAGCLTCACDAAGVCGPDRQAGPNGACVLPACTCDDVPAEPVCGADGRTWSSPCAATCAGVPIAREGACEIACLGLASCADLCHGLRAIDADGCPTCACRAEFAADAASCAACPLEYAPVCGSDGVTYPNRCRARCAGARVLYAGACSDACRTAPAGCTLDCPNGLRPVAGGGHCLACACADVQVGCDLAEGPVCATLPGPIGATTLGSACVALALGATDGVWGACGEACDDETPCAEGRCGSGFFAGRCVVDDSPCGCSALREPVCGVDGTTWDNACIARCAGVDVAHVGACCEAVRCEGDVVVDRFGCPACGTATTADCALNAAFAPACRPDGTSVEGSACAAHARGEAAFVEYCP